MSTGIIIGILGSPGKWALEKRVLNASMLVSASICSVIVLQSLAYSYSADAIILAVISAIFFWVLFAFGRIRPRSDWLLWFFLAANYLVLSLDWLFIGGTGGLAIITFIAISGIMPLITRPNQVKTGYASAGLFFLFLLGSSLLYLDDLPRHSANLSRMMERMVEVCILSLGLAVINYIGVSSFRQQKKKVLDLNDQLNTLNQKLEKRNEELEKALGEVKTLRGIIPICANCKKVRNDEGYFEAVESYIHRHTLADFTHGICPDCAKKLYPEIYGGQED